jgi:hypothetical protein
MGMSRSTLRVRSEPNSAGLHDSEEAGEILTL